MFTFNVVEADSDKNLSTLEVSKLQDNTILYMECNEDIEYYNEDVFINRTIDNIHKFTDMHSNIILHIGEFMEIYLKHNNFCNKFDTIIKLCEIKNIKISLYFIDELRDICKILTDNLKTIKWMFDNYNNPVLFELKERITRWDIHEAISAYMNECRYLKGHQIDIEYNDKLLKYLYAKLNEIE